MTRPTRELTLMKVAHLVAERSTCSRLHVGAVVARDGRVLATGYNGAPAGLPHCDHKARPDDPCEVSVHAEANLVAFAARYGVSLAGAEMYTTASPCLACAQLLVNAGVRRVFFSEVFRDKRGQRLLEEVGVEVRRW